MVNSKQKHTLTFYVGKFYAYYLVTLVLHSDIWNLKNMLCNSIKTIIFHSQHICRLTMVI